MEYEQITVEADDTISVLTLNRPERLNAWTPQMGGELMDAIRVANRDPEIEGMVVTGAGRGFCAGADIEAVFKTQADGESDAHAPEMDDWVSLIRGSKPIVAAVNGAAIGVGLSQILAFDRLIVARDAKLSMRFIKMGLVPELASSTFLTLRCGFGTSSDLMLTGRTISGEEAAALGVVDEAVDPAELMPTALGAARAMGQNPIEAVRAVKTLLTENATETDLELVQRREGRALAAAYRSPEHKEAIDAFLGKREPDFRRARQP